MGLLKSVIKTGVAVKTVDLLRREAAKPQNQAKAKELLGRIRERGKGGPGGPRG